jgi:methionyl-tRNA formyltransferase
MAGLIESGHEIVELFTWPTDNEYDFNTRVIAMAEDIGARITLSPMTDADVQRFGEQKIDAIISAAYPYKIPDWQGFVDYGLNIHPSPLPEGRGPWPLPHVILKDLQHTAVTIHELAPSWDEGDVIAQVSLAVSPRETLESLSLRSQILARKMLLEIMQDLPAAWANKTPQAQGSYWPMLRPKDKLIEWTMPVAEIDRMVRAFSKFEPSVYIDDIRYFVRKIDYWEENHSYTPGTLVHQGSREPVFAAADGFVALSHYVPADD